MFSCNLAPAPNGSSSASHPRRGRLFVFPPTLIQLQLAVHDRAALKRLLNVEIGDDWPVFDESLEFAIAGYGDPRTVGWGTWFGVELASQRLIAVGGFHQPPNDQGMVEFGYAISADSRGRGLGTEFVAALLRHALSDPRVTEVIAHTMADGQISPEGFDNLASTAILRRLGFAHVGDDQGEWRWSLTRSPNPGASAESPAVAAVS